MCQYYSKDFFRFLWNFFLKMVASVSGWMNFTFRFIYFAKGTRERFPALFVQFTKIQMRTIQMLCTINERNARWPKFCNRRSANQTVSPFVISYAPFFGSIVETFYYCKLCIWIFRVFSCFCQDKYLDKPTSFK